MKMKISRCHLEIKISARVGETSAHCSACGFFGSTRGVPPKQATEGHHREHQAHLQRMRDPGKRAAWLRAGGSP